MNPQHILCERDKRGRETRKSRVSDQLLHGADWAPGHIACTFEDELLNVFIACGRARMPQPAGGDGSSEKDDRSPDKKMLYWGFEYTMSPQTKRFLKDHRTPVCSMGASLVSTFVAVSLHHDPTAPPVLTFSKSFH